MGNCILNELAVRTDELTQGYVGVPDTDLAAFTDQSFDEMHHRALAEIIRTRFKTQPEDTYLSTLHSQHSFHSPLDVLQIAGQDRIQQRNAQIQLLAAVS